MALQHNGNTQGIYTIKPNSELQSFNVMCRKDGVNYITEVSHDFEVARRVQGYEACPGWYEYIVYNSASESGKKINIDALTSMVDQIEHCSQYAKVECRDSQAYTSGNTGQHNCMRAYDRNNNTIPYWAGGNTNKYCACGVTGTCYSSSQACNCDSTTPSLILQDEGSYTEKNLLPLQALIAGDTGSSNEYMKLKAGKLICWDT